jgi:hypothetical protein
MLALLKSSAPYVRSESDWRTVCAILKLVSGEPYTSEDRNLRCVSYTCCILQQLDPLTFPAVRLSMGPPCRGACSAARGCPSGV